MEEARISIRGLIVLGSALLLAACASGPSRQTTEPGAPKGGTYKVGQPYQVAGKWYYPKEDPHYDREGEASWYGLDFHGKATANGETYDMNDLTAAHTTLPMPSYVRVTNLANGRSLVLRINDRGPFVKNRIIDVSRRAAQLLGFENHGTTRVRVQAVAPDGSPIFVAGNQDGPPVMAAPVETVAVAALPEPVSAAAPGSQDTPQAAVVGNKQMFVQAGAFATYGNAERLADQLKALAAVQLSTVQSGSQRLYRVRLGPLASRDEADSLLGQVLSMGHGAARIVVD